MAICNIEGCSSIADIKVPEFNSDAVELSFKVETHPSGGGQVAHRITCETSKTFLLKNRNAP